MADATPAVSPLRRRMIDDMTLRNLSPGLLCNRGVKIQCRLTPLIRNVSFGALLADKAFDANWLLEELDLRGASAVIPPKSNRKQQRNYDADAYKWRHLIENYFAKIKEFRGIATRYDKTD